MKTQAQHRQDVVNYLRISSKHAFLRGEKGTFKIEEISEGVFTEVSKGFHPKAINIDYWVNEYKGDAKNVIKHRIFYDGHGFKSIPMKYYTKLNLPHADI